MKKDLNKIAKIEKAMSKKFDKNQLLIQNQVGTMIKKKIFRRFKRVHSEESSR